MRKLRFVIFGLVGALALTGCTVRPPADQIVLYYKAGAGDNKEFKQCIEPGQSGPAPVDDEAFYLPTSLRTWNIRPQGGDTDQPIRSGTKPVEVINQDGTKTTQPGPEVVVYAVTDFYLNTNCGGGRADNGGKESPIVQFWENTGRRAWKDGKGIASNGDGNFHEDVWRVMLLNTLVPAEEKTMRQETRKYNADDLDANLNGVWQQMERNLGPLFLAELRAKVGGDYFCGTGYQRGRNVEWTEWVVDEAAAPGPDGTKPVKEEKKSGPCPPVRISIIDVNFADDGIAKARADVFKAQQEAQAKLIRARAELEENNILGQANSEVALRYKEIEAQLAAAEACRANPNCTVIIDGRGNTTIPIR